MDCGSFRTGVGEDPSRFDEACERHAAQCAACSAYVRRMRASERLILEALRFDVPLLKGGAARAGAPSRVRAPRTALWAGLAAVLVAAFALWVGMDPERGGAAQALAAEVVEHWRHEPAAWTRTDVGVENAVLGRVVEGKVALDLDRLGLLVSYARSCYVRGEWVAHLVVQGQEGPVMLLLLPHERLDTLRPLDVPEENLHGELIPLGQGTAVLLGEDGERIEALRERVIEAVQWAI